LKREDGNSAKGGGGGKMLDVLEGWGGRAGEERDAQFMLGEEGAIAPSWARTKKGCHLFEEGRALRTSGERDL